MSISKNIYNLVSQGFENKCYLLLSEAYKKAMESTIDFTLLDENDISATLCKYIEESENSANWYVFADTEHYINNNSTVKKGFASSLKRIDFKMSSIENKHKIYFYMEAKNLKSNQIALHRRYVSTGIDNYINSNYPYGCLLGYIQKGSIVRNIERINTEVLQVNNRSAECLNMDSHQLFDNYYTSIHNDLRLNHIILDFTYNANN